MRRTRLAAALAAGLLALHASPGAAGNSSTYTGACHLVAAEDPSGQLAQPDTYTGVIRADVAMTSTDPMDVPVQGTVTCTVEVNGVTQVSESFSGTAVVAGRELVAYHADPGSTVEVCTEVDYTGPFDTTPTASSCVLAGPPAVQSPIVGVVFMVGLPAAQPAFLVGGNLANPAWWACTDNGNATPYQVSCVSQSSVPTWQCDVLYAEVLTAGPGSVARTSLDCDGGAPEAQTATVSGTGGNDVQAATSTVAVTAFTCTVDDGANGAAVPIWVGVCGA